MLSFRFATLVSVASIFQNVKASDQASTRTASDAISVVDQLGTESRTLTHSKREKNIKYNGKGNSIFSSKGKGSTGKGRHQAVFVVTNMCVTDGNCIRASDEATYPIGLNCEWTISAPATISVSYFDLEPIFDFLIVDGTVFSDVGAGLDGLSVSAGTIVTFGSDFNDSGNIGFEICLV